MDESMPFLRPPPRSVPISTRLVVLLGGQFAWLIWLFCAVGLVFGSVFAGNADWSSMLFFRGPLDTAQGTIISSKHTHFSEGGSKHSKGTPIYAHHYTFLFDDVEHKGTAYRVGGGLRDGSAVTVEFPVGRPDRSRIKGMRRAPFGPGTMLVLLFPLGAFIAAFMSLRKGLKNVRLLMNGELAEGRLISKQPTNVKVNNRTVYKLTFTFKDSRGEVRQTMVKTEQPEKLEDDRLERIFYDPLDPSRALLFDNLPGKQGFTADGELRACGFWPGARVMFWPAIMLIIVATLIAVRVHSKVIASAAHERKLVSTF